ncbi:alpha-N-methyltransferase NTM1 [Halteromyces radiatus]|uniref:alpha-N-methyltransferase NTM1 n=1 Tax=Halteromyces radiatus TaxID=101107 RepID=UPI00221E4CD7|nr:alpha-N-methyltransferase NTM1 [Halteromyces radiatus]KAI8077747.1 alpha-N-methyltransferase NTM1 [Halteromyces radiatus]
MEQPDWYSNAQAYWTSVEPTVDGMLGGFSQVDPIDVAGSLAFIDEYVHGVKGVNNTIKKEPSLRTHYACDCGAGIGRVTKHFLLRVPFDTVDLVEQTPIFVQQAKDSYLADDIQAGRVGQVRCQGLQDFQPDDNKYDLIWCQWVLGHLTDDDLINFFKRCIKGLAPGGLIGVKENNSTQNYVVDEEDSSVTRPNDALKRIFTAAGLTVIKEQVQQGLPAGLFTVRMYMLKPCSSSDST